MKLQLVDEKGNVIVRDKKNVEIELTDEVQIAAFVNQGWKVVEE